MLKKLVYQLAEYPSVFSPRLRRALNFINSPTPYQTKISGAPENGLDLFESLLSLTGQPTSGNFPRVHLTGEELSINRAPF